MWLTHFWHSWSQFFIFAWDVTAGGILRTGVLICLVGLGIGLVSNRRQAIACANLNIDMYHQSSLFNNRTDKILYINMNIYLDLNQVLILWPLIRRLLWIHYFKRKPKWLRRAFNININITKIIFEKYNITWIKARLLFIELPGTDLSENLVEIENILCACEIWWAKLAPFWLRPQCMDTSMATKSLPSLLICFCFHLD